VTPWAEAKKLEEKIAKRHKRAISRIV